MNPRLFCLQTVLPSRDIIGALDDLHPVFKVSDHPQLGFHPHTSLSSPSLCHHILPTSVDIRSRSIESTHHASKTAYCSPLSFRKGLWGFLHNGQQHPASWNTPPRSGHWANAPTLLRTFKNSATGIVSASHTRSIAGQGVIRDVDRFPPGTAAISFTDSSAMAREIFTPNPPAGVSRSPCIVSPGYTLPLSDHAPVLLKSRHSLVCVSRRTLSHQTQAQQPPGAILSKHRVNSSKEKFKERAER